MFPVVFRVAQFCLLAQIILAPLLLGGARPWAMGILSVLTGIGILALCAKMPIYLPRYLRVIWLMAGLASGWMIMQSLPIWPMQAAPFNADHIALYPTAWHSTGADILWFIATLTLASLLARKAPHSFIKQVCLTVACAAALQVGLAALDQINGWNTTFWFAKTAHIGDWTGSLANRNAFATLMIFGLLASLYCFGGRQQVRLGKVLDQKGGWLALAMVFAFALLQSHSRSGFVIALCSLSVFAVMQMRDNPAWHRILIPIGVFMFGIVFVALATPEFTTRFAELARYDLIQRDDAWASAVHAIMARPMTGFGPGSIALVIDHFATTGLNTNAHWFSSHNVWLDGAIVLGLPVMVVLLAMGGYAGFKTWHGLKPPRPKALFAASISIAVLSGSVDWVITLPALILPMGLVWVGCIEAAGAHHHEARAQTDVAAQSGVPDQASQR